MARAASKKKPARKGRTAAPRKRAAEQREGFTLRDVLRWAGRGGAAIAALFLAFVLLFAIVNPVMTPYMMAESWRRGGVTRDWVRLEDIAPQMARSVVAAEDANFCLHWGFDMHQIRAAIEEGAGRGASTITQQVVKNVFLWQGRSWPRKALEALLTPVVELVWTKRRILEVYLNVAETGPGVFGVQSAAEVYFKRPAAKLTEAQAGLIAAALPDPKGRNPARPSGYLTRRAGEIADGADTIRADGRAACFED
ncbi:MAG: monofunctional biosynthetic peptidoglycan transglycosylase [Defluviimonas sp.]|uniref:monofunctional biosynthetic peptidoglycan transglycosylase n=1 Tax=Albidovulum sp. TaxID=1872424 RepID=UPI002A25B7BA|nr:monofunctional biosynthetic peptidoglycan transglycosylase [Defluviimonas sp.]